MAEQRRILKKARVSTQGLEDYDVHALLVQSGSSDDTLAHRVQRYLEAKYRRDITEWGACHEQALLSRWQAGLECGKIDAVLWIAATHPSLSRQAIRKIFGDVHMLMHQQGQLANQVLRQRERLRVQKGRLRDNLQKVQVRHRETSQKLHALEVAYAELEHTLHAQERPEQKESVASLRAQLEKAERQNETRTVVIERLQVENDRLVSELASASESNRAMQAQLEKLQDALETMLGKEDVCQTCSQYDLCERRVLLVGGITRLRAAYRDLVAGAGGEFKYHDGYKSGGARALEEMICWADVVLCPVDINSHGACRSVKKICKKMGRPYHMMSSSGVSSVARVLAEYGRPAKGEQCA